MVGVAPGPRYRPQCHRRGRLLAGCRTHPDPNHGRRAGHADVARCRHCRRGGAARRQSPPARNHFRVGCVDGRPRAVRRRHRGRGRGRTRGGHRRVFAASIQVRPSPRARARSVDPLRGRHGRRGGGRGLGRDGHVCGRLTRRAADRLRMVPVVAPRLARRTDLPAADPDLARRARETMAMAARRRGAGARGRVSAN